MERSSKKKIWKIIISVLVIGAIIFSTVFITQGVMTSNCAVGLCESKLESMIAFLTNEDVGENVTIYYDICSRAGCYSIHMGYIRSFGHSESPEYGGLYKAEKFPIFLSKRDKEFIEKYNDFIDNYPDLSDIYEDYENKEIDILKAKELCFYRIYEALEESGLDYHYIYRYSDKFEDLD